MSSSNFASWLEEKQSSWLYRELAKCETDPRIAELFRALATAADFQADKWLASSPDLTPPSFAPSVRARIAVVLARLLSPRRVRHKAPPQPRAAERQPAPRPHPGSLSRGDHG